jgi:hypothetical protein
MRCENSQKEFMSDDSGCAKLQMDKFSLDTSTFLNWQEDPLSYHLPLAGIGL